MLHVKDAIWCDYPQENRNRPQSKVCPAHTSLINCQGSWFWPMVTPRPGLVHPLDFQKQARISATSLLVVQWANDGVLHWGIHQLAWERGTSTSALPFRNQKKNMVNEAGHTWQFFHFFGAGQITASCKFGTCPLLKWSALGESQHPQFITANSDCSQFSSLNNLALDLAGWLIDFSSWFNHIQSIINATGFANLYLTILYRPHVSGDISVIHQPNLRPRQGEWQSWDPWRFQRGSPIAMVQPTDRPGPKCGRMAMPRHPAWLLPCPGFAVCRPGWKVVETQEMGAKLSDAKCRKAWLWPSGSFTSDSVGPNTARSKSYTTFCAYAVRIWKTENCAIHHAHSHAVIHTSSWHSSAALSLVSCWCLSGTPSSCSLQNSTSRQ